MKNMLSFSPLKLITVITILTFLNACDAIKSSSLMAAGNADKSNIVPPQRSGLNSMSAGGLTMLGLQGVQTERGMMYSIDAVLFDFDKASLNASAQATVDQLAGIIQQNAGRYIAVEGHTDNVGSKSYNQDLSERRAESVAQALVSRGVDYGRLQVKGFGENRPVVSNKSASGRQKNRRVEVTILN
ncbi:outer membrane protein/peptidoglycan-associated (lipo)protein [Beggiatoa alba B18LD]|uniref:Outer membrane protein/peptidoglycan-associated (Lipo)protein n=1 Tax=Beggiatoa alba B18LD TaxID=395493 RepID=I3CDJ2_9GAMM|nr:OmpA family protein [Beggiatoa alba]EIJ41685.1 outer membrane protein/peptidoglycan-associated (lipo)protein [Beggiatoa alba B18LD]